MKPSVPGEKSKHEGDKALADSKSLTNAASHKKTKISDADVNTADMETYRITSNKNSSTLKPIRAAYKCLLAQRLLSVTSIFIKDFLSLFQAASSTPCRLNSSVKSAEWTFPPSKKRPSQTYITLSHADHWTHMIGEMNLEQTYWHIIELLDDESDLWVQETLTWWNNQSKTLATPLMGKQADHDDSEDDMVGICAQRAKILQARATAKMSALNKRVTELGVESNPFSDSEQMKVTQHAPAKVVQGECHHKGSRPRPRPIKANTGATIQGTASEKTATLEQEQHELEDTCFSLTAGMGVQDTQHESDNEDTIDVTTADETAYDVEDSAPKERLGRLSHTVTQTPAPTTPVGHHTSSHLQAKPAPMKMSTQGTATSQKQCKEKWDAGIGDSRVALTTHEDPNTIIDDNATTRKAQVVTQCCTLAKLSRLVGLLSCQASESRPQLSTAIPGATGKKISALQDQHRSGEGSATHIALTGDIKCECYVDDSQLDSTPLSDFTDDDAKPGNKMTSQLHITISVKRTKSNNMIEQDDSSTTPAPQKKAKRTPSAAPTKRNPARKNHANGF
ncbi:hypothetical protein V8E55_004139 [Tylopilus felleus]